MPRLSPEIPAVVTSSKADTSGALAVAEALLRGGVLREDDWAGDLSGATEAGLRRWLADRLPVAGLSLMDLSLCFTDDTDGFGYSSAFWREAVQNPGETVYLSRRSSAADIRPVAGFGLEMHSYGVIAVQTGVERLEAVEPGAGYAVLELVERALLCTVGAATLRWGAQEAARLGEMLKEDREGSIEHLMGTERLTREQAEEKFRKEYEIEDHVTEEGFYEDLPRAAVFCTWDGAAVVRAEERLRETDGAGDLWTACQAALDLDGLLGSDPVPPKDVNGAPAVRVGDALAFNDHTGLFLYDYYEVVEHPFPVVVRWNTDDWMMRLVDDYHQNAAENGEENAITWFVGFDSEDAAGADRAVAALVLVIDVLRRVDQLLCCLAPDDWRSAAKADR